MRLAQTFNMAHIKIFITQVKKTTLHQNDTGWQADTWTVSQEESLSLLMAFSPYFPDEDKSIILR